MKDTKMIKLCTLGRERKWAWQA